MNSQRLHTGLRVAGSCLFAGFVIWQSLERSIVMHDERYWNVLDDALITMRYGWNLAHGLGPVWNAGEAVEGYTNPLLMLLASLFSLIEDKRLAVLGLQVVGALGLLATAWFAARITETLCSGLQDVDDAATRNAGSIVFLATLVYYPLFGLLCFSGLETGLVTGFLTAGAWLALRNQESHHRGYLALMSVLLAAAYLSRPDSALPASLIMGYAIIESFGSAKDLRAWILTSLAAGLPFSLILATHLALRWSFYGDLAPNTYYLKLDGIPLSVRIGDGIVYLRPLVRDLWGPVGLAALGVWAGRTLGHVLLAAIFACLLGYHIYVGGDFLFGASRFILPAVPLCFALAAVAALRGASLIPLALGPARKVAGPAALALVVLFLPNLSYGGRWLEGEPAVKKIYKIALRKVTLIDALSEPDAVIGVRGAGYLPYYTGRPAVDLLGKNDPHIARLPPHLDVLPAQLRGARIWPGHVKYDFAYSIGELRPDILESVSHLDHDYSTEAALHYLPLQAGGSTLLHLRKGSAKIHWDQLQCDETACTRKPQG